MGEDEASLNHPAEPDIQPLVRGSSGERLKGGRPSGQGKRWDDAKHPEDVWTDPHNANIELGELLAAYKSDLAGREKPASGETVVKYLNTLKSFMRSLEAEGEPLILSSMRPSTVRRWIVDQRSRGLSEDGIASRLNALKAFSNKYVFKTLEVTTRDLLDKVKRFQPKERSVPELTEEQQRMIMDCFDRGTFEDVRNRAMIAVFLATGLRFGAVLNIELSRLNRVTGDLRVITKGDEWHMVRLSPRALREVRAYLRRRPENDETERLWLAEDGRPLGKWGAQAIFRRLRTRSGIPTLHAHVFRHNFSKKAARAGAKRSELQDMLGQKTDAVARHYLGDVAKEIAAINTARFSPIG